MKEIERRSFLAGASAALLAIVTGCGDDKSDDYVPIPTPNRRDPLTIGLSTGSSVLYAAQSDLDTTIDAIQSSGATSVRIDVSWTFAEPSPGQFDWAPSDRVVDAAVARGLSILATITNTPEWAGLDGAELFTAAPEDPSVYGEFAGRVAGRYRGKVQSYEIWNEPNGRQFFGPDPDPVRYTEMLEAAFVAIKAADPTAVVVAGALGNIATGDGVVDGNEFLDAMYAAGARGSFDALSVHPYDFGEPIGDAAVYPNSPMQQMITMHRTMTGHADGDKKIWITEYGAPTRSQDPGVTADEQATLIVDSAQQWPEVSFAGPFYVYTVRDAASGSPNIEDNYGILYDSYAPKPAYTQLAALIDSRIPIRPEATSFDAHWRPELGDSLSPVYAVTEGSTRQYENGSLFRSSYGWWSSPTAIADFARMANTVPIGPFENGYQDLMSDTGIRVFSDSRFGTHALYGPILDAWVPELGFPLGDEYSDEDGFRTAVFENGNIKWSETTGAVVALNG